MGLFAKLLFSDRCSFPPLAACCCCCFSSPGVSIHRTMLAICCWRIELQMEPYSGTRKSVLKQSASFPCRAAVSLYICLIGPIESCAPIRGYHCQLSISGNGKWPLVWRDVQCCSVQGGSSIDLKAQHGVDFHSPMGWFMSTCGKMFAIRYWGRWELKSNFVFTYDGLKWIYKSNPTALGVTLKACSPGNMANSIRWCGFSFWRCSLVPRGQVRNIASLFLSWDYAHITETVFWTDFSISFYPRIFRYATIETTNHYRQLCPASISVSHFENSDATHTVTPENAHLTLLVHHPNATLVATMAPLMSKKTTPDSICNPKSKWIILVKIHPLSPQVNSYI